MVQTNVGILFSSHQVFPKESSEFVCNTYFLMQTEEALATLIEQDEVVIQGNDADEAVMCTPTETFSIRRAETSNLILTIDREPFQLQGYEPSPAFISSLNSIPEIGQNIIHSTYTYLEAIKKKPDLCKIIHSLDTLTANTDIRNTKSLSTEELFNTFQASKFELLKYLESINAIELEGKWLVLDIQYMKQILNLIVLTDIELDMQNKIDFEDLKVSLVDHNISDNVILHLLTTHSKSSSSSKLFDLCTNKLCKSIGHAILAQSVIFPD